MFDHQRTLSRLDALPPRLRAGVGVVCLERVLPIADAVTDTELLRDALARIGRWAAGDDVLVRDVRDILDAHTRKTEVVVPAPKAKAPRDEDDDDEHDDDDRKPARGALDRMVDTFEDGVRALARIVDPEERSTSAVAATAMAAASKLVQRFGHYCDANELLVFEEIAWQERVLGEAEASGDAARLRTLLDAPPAWAEQLEDAF